MTHAGRWGFAVVILVALAAAACGGGGSSGGGSSNPPPSPPSITTSSLPSATVCTTYAATLKAASGSTPYKWSIIAGNLPSGFSLDPSAGAISGTPTAAGTSSFTVQVTDRNSETATKALSIAVNSSANVSICISPTSSTVGYGATQQFTATVSGASNTAVTWSVSSSGSSSSSQIGTISSSGLYTAPAATSISAESAAQMVTVTAGQTVTGTNISVPPLNSVNSITVKATSQADTSVSASATVTLTGLSVLAVGQCVPDSSNPSTLNCTASATGTEISQGTTVFLFVAGFGIVPGTNYNISSNGTDVVVTQPLPSQFQTASDGTPVVYFNVNVLPGATPGARNLIVRNSGNELTSFVGAVNIIP